MNDQVAMFGKGYSLKRIIHMNILSYLVIAVAKKKSCRASVLSVWWIRAVVFVYSFLRSEAKQDANLSDDGSWCFGLLLRRKICSFQSWDKQVYFTQC